ncbi:hypothetical protein VSDG_03554 [Cytospora chrysosperma]|uniref:2EXR domain-containing protein n=1 Tax=Cytospora chrysosperma TaxID=252740 RepID=A0A423W9Q2_CYTCH|nr:hypothetical protein VSDG_03554 [Valsa sordida]
MSDDQVSDEHSYNDSDRDEHSYNDSDRDEDDESQDSSSDEEATGNGLFDLEASEDDSEAAYEGQNGFGYDDGDYLESFPEFMKLPAELREMVWKAFCPDLTTGPRLFEIYVMESPLPRLIPGPALENQTAPTRTLLAVNRESRGLALKSSPHTFSLSAGEIIRYHEEKDIIHVVTSSRSDDAAFLLAIQELGDSLQNLAFSFKFLDNILVDACYLLPSVRRLFVLFDESELQDVPVKNYAWTVSENVHHYYSKTQEDGEAGLVITIERMLCWPDLDKHRDFAQENIELRETGWSSLGDNIRVYRNILADPLATSHELSQDYVTEEMLTEAVTRIQKIEVWPMVQFNGHDGIQLFNDMKAWDRPWDEWGDSGFSGSDDTEDEYDSEGIDDDSIHDHLSTDDEDDLPGQLLADDSSDQGTLGQLLGSPSEANDHLAAQFSSDDDDEGENQADHEDASSEEEEEEEEEDAEDLQTRASRPKRRVVESDSEDQSVTETEEPRPAASRRGLAVLADSEDESDEEGDHGPLPAQGRNRRARAVPSDSEDDDDMPQLSRTTQNRRSRALPAESDDDDDDGSETREAVVNQQNASSSTEDSSGGSSDDSSDDEDDEPPPLKRMSLAQRLRMEAQHARSGHLDEEDSDADGNDGGASFASFDDDEEDGDGTAQEYSIEDGESEEEI